MTAYEAATIEFNAAQDVYHAAVAAMRAGGSFDAFNKAAAIFKIAQAKIDRAYAIREGWEV